MHIMRARQRAVIVAAAAITLLAPVAAVRSASAPCLPGTAGVITTVAGGVGGPARATSVALIFPCGVSFGGGRLYIAGVGLVRAVDPGTDWLTTPAGSGRQARLVMVAARPGQA